ncbi:MAG: metal-dependent hydrolase, partial [Saprospiraceae bacterium]|nr:metal-dependent hydrolase [Saprospiraceae bacterium]
MDSLTQIILGAAVGEAVLGKKVGNRAMVWGAIAGTIPDLDVLSNGFMSPIDALAFHRGFSHSFVFSVLASVLLGWLVYRMYKLPYHRWFGIAGWGILVTSIGLLVVFTGEFKITKFLLGLLIMSGLGWLVYKRYFRKGYSSPDVDLKQWQWMFFLSLVTHPILDCFTTYGTQFLLPFSNQRIAFSNIAVADPFYTLPFIICLLIAMFLPRTSPKRAVWNRCGLIISSLYMIFTIYNKTRINTIFENSLRQENLIFSRYMTSPSILNNILWSGIAETDSAFYYGQYSFFDKEKVFKLSKKDKNRSPFGTSIDTNQTMKTLRWLSNDYFVLERKNGDTLQYFDLRFGTFRMKSTEPDNFVFKFNVLEKPVGNFILLNQGEGPRDADIGEVFKVLWNRVLGRTP